MRRCAIIQSVCNFGAGPLAGALIIRGIPNMKTEIVTLDTAAELDAFVMAHPEGRYEQVSAWGRLKERDWRGIICRKDSGEITGTMAVMFYPIHGTKYNLAFAPRGPIADRRDNETFETLVNAAKELGKTFNAFTLRIDPAVYEDDDTFRQEVLKQGFKIDAIDDFTAFSARMTYILDLKGKTPEELLAAFHTRTRYNIRLSQRKGVTIEVRGPEDAETFNEMMLTTASRDGFHARGADYYRRVLELFGENSRMFFAMYEGKPVAGSIAVRFGPHTWSLYAGSTSNMSCKPNEALKWADINWALEGGCEIYDFQGVEGYPTEDNPEIGLHKFKQGFNSEFKAYLGQMDLPLKPVAAKLIPAAQKLWVKIRG